MENENKASDLRFSHFTKSEIKFNHEAGGVFQSMFETEEDFKKAQSCVLEMLKNVPGSRTSEHIEAVINADYQLSWKVLGLMMISQAMTKASIHEAIKALPDETPTKMVKPLLMLALMSS